MCSKHGLHKRDWISLRMHIMYMLLAVLGIYVKYVYQKCIPAWLGSSFASLGCQTRLHTLYFSLGNSPPGHSIKHFLTLVISQSTDDAEFYGAHTPPRAIPFQFGEKEAVDAFEAWHNANYLSPGDLLTRTTEPIKQVSLPFWLFEATVDVQYRGEAFSILPHAHTYHSCLKRDLSCWLI